MTNAGWAAGVTAPNFEFRISDFGLDLSAASISVSGSKDLVRIENFPAVGFTDFGDSVAGGEVVIVDAADFLNADSAVGQKGRGESREIVECDGFLGRFEVAADPAANDAVAGSVVEWRREELVAAEEEDVRHATGEHTSVGGGEDGIVLPGGEGGLAGENVGPVVAGFEPGGGGAGELDGCGGDGGGRRGGAGGFQEGGDARIRGGGGGRAVASGNVDSGDAVGNWRFPQKRGGGGAPFFGGIEGG